MIRRQAVLENPQRALIHLGRLGEIALLLAQQRKIVQRRVEKSAQGKLPEQRTASARQGVVKRSCNWCSSTPALP